MCKDAIVFFNKPEGAELEAGKTYHFCIYGRLCQSYIFT